MPFPSTNPHELEKNIRQATSTTGIASGFHQSLTNIYSSVSGQNGTIDSGLETVLGKCVKELYRKFEERSITAPTKKENFKGGYIASFREDFVGEQQIVKAGFKDFLELEGDSYFLAENGQMISLERDSI